MRPGPRLRPGRGMEARLDGERHETVPGGMKDDLVAAISVTVEGLEFGRIAIGGKSQRDRLAAAEPAAERGELRRRPPGALALDRLAERAVAGEEIVIFERRRL